MHLDLDEPVALAGLTPPALDVEREAPRPVAALARLFDLREELANRREQSRVRCGIGARRAPDRTLVDADHLVEMLEPFDLRVGRRLLRAVVEVPSDGVVDRVVDEGRFARSRNAGHAHEQTDR